MPLALQLAAWYVALLVPTLVFKLAYVWTLSAGDLQTLQPAAVDGTRPPVWWLIAGHLLPADAVDVALGLAALFVTGYGLLRIAPARLAVASTAIVLAAGAAILLALGELGTLPSTTTVGAALHWSARDLSATAAFLTRRRMAFLGAGAVWLLAPFALTWLLHRVSARRPVRQRAIVLVLLAGLGFAVGRAPHTLLPGTTGSPLTRSVWRSSVLALTRVEAAPPPDLARAPSPQALVASYRHLAFPAAGTGSPPWLVEVPPALRVPRHIVLITLETAPHAYYDLDRADLPALRAMRAHAVVADQHQTTAPMSSMALYSLLSGTYPRPGVPLVRYGSFQADGLPALLGRRGYDTTYIDSYDLRWNGPEEADTMRALGFDTIRDARSDTLPPQPDLYTRRIARERHSFELARRRIADAVRDGRHALVTITTHLGHFDWLTPTSTGRQTARDKLADTLRTIDTLLGDFLAALAADGVGNNLIVVVTGDHGLRFRAEFESLREPFVYGDAAFHVPLLLYAPALFPEEVRVPHVTSHVDVTPTLLDLTGTSRDAAVHHGGNVLDPDLAERITFLPSGVFPGLRPVDAFHWRGVFYYWHGVVDRVTFRLAGDTIEEPIVRGRPGAALTDGQVRSIIRESRRLFNETGAVFLVRGR